MCLRHGHQRLGRGLACRREVDLSRPERLIVEVNRVVHAPKHEVIRPELLEQRRAHYIFDVHIDVAARHLALRLHLRGRRDTVVGGQNEERVSEADLLADNFEQPGQQPVGPDAHVAHLGSVGAGLVAHVVVRGKGDRQQVGRAALPQLLAVDRGFHQFLDQFVAPGAGGDPLIGPGAAGIRVEVPALESLPLLVQVFPREPQSVEVRDPGGKLRIIKSAADERAALVVEPERAIRTVAGRQNCAPRLERDANHLRAPVAVLQLVADGVHQQAAR